MNATERFESLYLNAIKYACQLEAALEQAQARIAELEAKPKGK